MLRIVQAFICLQLDLYTESSVLRTSFLLLIMNAISCDAGETGLDRPHKSGIEVLRAIVANGVKLERNWNLVFPVGGDSDK